MNTSEQNKNMSGIVSREVRRGGGGCKECPRWDTIWVRDKNKIKLKLGVYDTGIKLILRFLNLTLE